MEINIAVYTARAMYINTDNVNSFAKLNSQQKKILEEPARWVYFTYILWMGSFDYI